VKNYYDEHHQIKERSTLKLNFTIDQRFVDANIAEKLTKDVGNFFNLNKVEINWGRPSIV